MIVTLDLLKCVKGKKLLERKYIVLAKLEVKVKVKYTLVQALWLCTGRTAHGGGG
jgi:hypothetical protein